MDSATVCPESEHDFKSLKTSNVNGVITALITTDGPLSEPMRITDPEIMESLLSKYPRIKLRQKEDSCVVTALILSDGVEIIEVTDPATIEAMLSLHWRLHQERVREIVSNDNSHITFHSFEPECVNRS